MIPNIRIGWVDNVSVKLFNFNPVSIWAHKFEVFFDIFENMKFVKFYCFTEILKFCLVFLDKAPINHIIFELDNRIVVIVIGHKSVI